MRSKRPTPLFQILRTLSSRAPSSPAPWRTTLHCRTLRRPRQPDKRHLRWPQTSRLATSSLSMPRCPSLWTARCSVRRSRLRTSVYVRRKRSRSSQSWHKKPRRRLPRPPAPTGGTLHRTARPFRRRVRLTCRARTCPPCITRCWSLRARRRRARCGEFGVGRRAAEPGPPAAAPVFLRPPTPPPPSLDLYRYRARCRGRHRAHRDRALACVAHRPVWLPGDRPRSARLRPGHRRPGRVGRARECGDRVFLVREEEERRE